MRAEGKAKHTRLSSTTVWWLNPICEVVQCRTDCWRASVKLSQWWQSSVEMENTRGWTLKLSDSQQEPLFDRTECGLTFTETSVGFRPWQSCRWCYIVSRPQSSWLRLEAGSSPTKQIACCCVDWGPLHTKVCFPGTEGPRTGPCTLRPASGERKGSVSGQGPLERWKENSPLPPACVAGPHAASNHLWVVTRPDWAERIWVGNFKTCSCFCERERICITHSELMDFPMFGPDSPFLLTCSNNESLMSGFPSPPLLGPVSSRRVEMLCRPFHPKSEAYGESLNCCLLGTRVSGSTSHNTVIWLNLQIWCNYSFRRQSLYLRLTIMWERLCDKQNNETCR